MKTTLAITIGDFNGIGPEVILKSLKSPAIQKLIDPVLIGSFQIFQYYAKKFKSPCKLVEAEAGNVKATSGAIPVINVNQASERNIQIGRIAPDAGVCAGLSLEKAVQLCVSGTVDGMVTGPVSKAALHFAGYNFPGQTEMLAMLSRSDRVTMMLISPAMRVALATIHTPLRMVVEQLFVERIVEKLETVHLSLRNDFRIEHPKIAILGINPHAGENGAIGTEEKTILLPAMQKAQERFIDVAGPFPADGFFAAQSYTSYDAVLAMYHDQGLIPLKMSGFNKGVNFSAGLRIIRTSPDHGTAFEIAGRNIADPGSMISAIKLAASIVQNRKK